MITKNNFKKLLQIPACSLLIAIIFNSCRTEELSKGGKLQSSVNQKNLTSRKVFPKEFQNIPSLNENFKTSESVLSQSISTGKMILENAVIDSAYAIEATDGNIISYTFPVYRKNQKNHFENLVLQKKIGDQNFKSYLYQYSRSASVGYDKNNIEIIPLDNLQNSNQGKIIFISHSFTNGCTDITILSVDCNEGGHHSNGTFCPTLGSYMPSDYVVTSNNCTAGGPSDGGSDSPGNPNSGNNQTGGTVIDPDDLPANIQNQMLTTPIPNMPKWGNPLTYTPNFLELNSSQLSFINNTAQNGFRAEMDMFLSNNGINELFGNPTTETLNPDAKAVGQWLVNYYITNSEFQNSENWSDLVNADLQFQQFTKDFLTQNPDITWTQFENWFMIPSEGKDWNYDANFWNNPSLTFPIQNLPSWNSYSNAYPNQTSAQMYGVVGGEVAQAQIDYPVQTRNGCALKVSRALNYSGVIIPNIPGQTLKGADNKNYFLNAKALNAWMRKTFGTHPTNPKHINLTKAAGGTNGKNFPNLLKNKKGIFSLVSPTNSLWASGHADILYANGTCKAGCHFFDGDILYIDFWELN